MFKRLFDITSSMIGLILISPLFIVLMILISLESKGGPFFKQVRVGRHNKDFKIFKFRTMFVGSDKKGLLTLGDKDNRVTNVGYFLRKYKLDEFPQLINVIKGDMSVVGPRPEVRKYIDILSEEDKRLLSVRPGITDYASIKFVNESEVLKNSSDPEKTYLEDILPEKVKLGLEYAEKANLATDLKIIFITIARIIGK